MNKCKNCTHMYNARCYRKRTYNKYNNNSIGELLDLSENNNGDCKYY